MNKFFIFLLGVCLLMVQPIMADESDFDENAPAAEEKVSPADARSEAREAAAWMKEHMALRKKVLSILKKIKNDKTAAKAAQSLEKLTGKDNVGKKTALGEVGDSRLEMPSTSAMSAVLKKNSKKLEKNLKEIENEVERIEELELEESDFLSIVDEVLSVTDVDADSDDDEDDE